MWWIVLEYIVQHGKCDGVCGNILYSMGNVMECVGIYYTAWKMWWCVWEYIIQRGKCDGVCGNILYSVGNVIVCVGIYYTAWEIYIEQGNIL